MKGGNVERENHSQFCEGYIERIPPRGRPVMRSSLAQLGKGESSQTISLLRGRAEIKP